MMTVCKSCSAPLPANTNICQYCGVRNDVDFQDKQQYTVQTQQSERICPVCHISLQTIDLKINGHFYIEHCQTCFGLFFDPGEIETLLENWVSGVFSINRDLIENINQERYPTDHKVKYLKCPVCQVLMNRVNFGYRSGVVVNQCTAHGIWLGSGEMTHLLEWKKAGGQLWDQQHKQEVRLEEQVTQLDLNRDFSYHHSYPDEHQGEPHLLRSLSTLVSKLFE